MGDGCISVILWRSTKKQLQQSPITRIGRSGISGIGLRMAIFRGKGRRGAKEEDKKANAQGDSEVYRGSPPLDAQRRSGVPQGRIQA